MSSSVTLARPYARAAFESARDAGLLDEWERKLHVVAAMVANPQVRGCIGDPRLTTAQISVLLLPDAESTDTTFAAFIATLTEYGRLRLLPEITALFDAFKREHGNVLRVVVRAAVAIDATQADALKGALKRRFQREIDLHTQIDAALIGGAVIDAGDIVIDGSVRGKLDRLAQALVS